MPTSPSPSSTRRILAEVNNPRLSLFDESSSRERQTALTGRIAEYAIITLVVIIIAGMEIARWKFDAPPQPLIFSFVALCLTVYACTRVALIWRQLAVLRREQMARQNLRSAIDDICARGWLLFDGLSDPRGHLLGSVLAGPGGIFTLVPRFISHGGDLSEKVRQPDADTLMIGTHKLLADPLGQARRAARSLYEVLAAGGLETVAVQPVVVFPGWSVEPPPEGIDQDVWVISDRDIVTRFTHAPTVLEAKELIGVSLLLERLSKHS